jgi:hypothetical protein
MVVVIPPSSIADQRTTRSQWYNIIGDWPCAEEYVARMFQIEFTPEAT